MCNEDNFNKEKNILKKKKKIIMQQFFVMYVFGCQQKNWMKEKLYDKQICGEKMWLHMFFEQKTIKTKGLISLQFLQLLSRQKPFWGKGRLPSLVNKRLGVEVAHQCPCFNRDKTKV